MLASFFHRLTGLLCLGTALLMGVSPPAGMILCLEPDGSVALEFADRKLPCDPDVESASAGRPATSASAASSPCCACIDIPVDAAGDEVRVPPPTVELRLDLAPAPRAGSTDSLLAPLARRARVQRSGSPGPPGDLAHVRTVVLRV